MFVDEAEREPLLASLERIAELPIERVIIPHGDPIQADGAARIRAAVGESRHHGEGAQATFPHTRAGAGARPLTSGEGLLITSERQFSHGTDKSVAPASPSSDRRQRSGVRLAVPRNTCTPPSLRIRKGPHCRAMTETVRSGRTDAKWVSR